MSLKLNNIFRREERFMQKERFGSFMHRVGCSIILSMFYVTIVDILVNIIIVIANILPKIDNMPAIMQLVLENEIWN